MITLQWSKRVRKLEEAAYREQRLRSRIAQAYRWLAEYPDTCAVLAWLIETDFDEDPAIRGNMDVAALRDRIRARHAGLTVAPPPPAPQAHGADQGYESPQ